MAKCIKHRGTNKIIRVDNHLAALEVARGAWVYVSKSDYKRYLNRHGKKQPVEPGSEAQPQIS